MLKRRSGGRELWSRWLIIIMRSNGATVFTSARSISSNANGAAAFSRRRQSCKHAGANVGSASLLFVSQVPSPRLQVATSLWVKATSSIFFSNSLRRDLTAPRPTQLLMEEPSSRFAPLKGFTGALWYSRGVFPPSLSPTQPITNQGPISCHRIVPPQVGFI